MSQKILQLLTQYDESFTIKAARLWNILPPELTQITSLVEFKSGLDSFLSTVPDEPPIPGYPYKCDNFSVNICA